MSTWTEPVLVYLAATLAVALTLIEIVLPTFGIAGFSAVALSVLAAWGLGERGLSWLPFAFIALALCFWAIDLLTPMKWWRWVATAVFALASAGFAFDSGTAASWVVAAVATTGLAALMYPLDTAVARLNGRPPSLGLDALTGQVGVVERWDAGAGTVMLSGSRWSATGPPFVSVSQRVVVTGHDRLTLTVELDHYDNMKV